MNGSTSNSASAGVPCSFRHTSRRVSGLSSEGDTFITTIGLSDRQGARPYVFDLVIFDNDGVLVDSEPHANEILAALLTQVGLPTTYEDSIAEFMGGSFERVRRMAEDRLGEALPVDFEDQYHARLFERFRTALEPVRDVVWALDRIDIPTCVASSGTHDRIRVSLEVTGLYPRFAGRIYSATDVERGKPAPDLFLHAARRQSVPPRRCAVIEDTALGIEAANAAGMTSFGFAAMGPVDRLAHATGGIFHSMRDLPDLLRAPAGEQSRI